MVQLIIGTMEENMLKLNKIYMKQDLKQGQRIKFQIGDLIGTGKIVGKALINQPIIGGTYIVEPDQPIINETYDYTHFVAHEINLTLIK